MNATKLYDDLVFTKFTLYKSLFSNLPYKDIKEIATYLPVFAGLCDSGLKKGKSPAEITDRFLREYQKNAANKQELNILFKFIQFIERQVVLFDALEDASFNELHREGGAGTLKELFTQIEAHHKEQVLSDALSKFHLRLVLTAHPTQFYTSQVLSIITELTELFKINDIAKINRLLLQLSKTPFFKKDKPTPFQEAEKLTWYLNNIFYHAIPIVYHRIDEYLGLHGRHTEDINPVELGFWPGGDRDGNPYVTHETTINTASLLHHSILKCYRKDVKQLKHRLTFKKVDELIERVDEKLVNAISGQKGKPQYKDPQEVKDDLLEIKGVLVKEHEGIYTEEIDLLLLKIRLFGFHFVYMDVRQNSRVHSQVVSEILDSANYSRLDESGKLKALKKPVPSKRKFSELATEVLNTVRSIRQIQKENGADAVNRYIISNCGSVVDIAEVIFLFKAAGWKLPVPVDIVPLFETVDDLRDAGKTMQQLYRDGDYRKHLKSRGDKQVIMLGFSDGTKDGGYLSANWGIHKAKMELTKISEAAGIRVVFFDGRGGPSARGGGKAHLFYASMDDTIATDEIQLTIQGQSISANYGIPEAAIFNIEQLLHGVMSGKLLLSARNKLSRNQFSLLEQLSKDSYEAYLKLKKDELFLKYMEEFSPIKYLAKANVTSRPASRSKGTLKYEDLRAITFVGSWYQMKQNVPGFYGLGAALKKMEQRGQLSSVQELYRQSQFFKALVDNCMMALSKTDFSLTNFLKQDKQFSRLWMQIKEEYETCALFLLKITGMSTLMENDPVSKKSIQIRENMVIPLAVIQQYALGKMKEETLSDNDKQLFEKMMVRTLYGMTNAGRNSI